MNKFGKWISNHTKIVLILTVILIVPAIFGIISTKINYDILSYLPQDLDFTKGQKVLEDVYSDAATSMLIIEGMKDKDVVERKDKIKNIKGVENAIWIDDALDISVPKDMIASDMQQNKISLEEAKAKTNKYIGEVYGNQGASLKAVINKLTSNDFTQNQMKLDVQKISGYGESMDDIMSNIKELQGLEPIIRATDSVLSNSNSRSAISRFYSNYKSDSTQKLIKGLEDGILSLNSDDLKAIEGLKSNLNDLSVDIEANKNNIESINKMVDGIKENPELLQKLNKFSSDLKNSESTIKDIEKILSKGDGSLNIKEVKALGERLLSIQQDLKDSEDILRITKGSLEKNNVQRARELIKSLPELEDGVDKLAEGSTKLNEGMEEFYKEGIEKLNDKGEEVTEKIDDLVQVKDELVKMSKDYDTFTGKNSCEIYYEDK